MKRYTMTTYAPTMIPSIKEHPKGEWVRYKDVQDTVKLSDQTDHDMITDVADLARNIVIEVMTKGHVDGKRGWEEQPPEFHIERALNHINYPPEESFFHALTRIAMALWCMQK